MIPRLIPNLLLKDRKLVKTAKFKDPVYVGDPVNTVKIFNDREVDEIVLLDIGASPRGHEPQYELLAEIASECFIPLAYGGGITSLACARRIFSLGFEKVVLNSSVYDNPGLIREIADVYGSQAVVVSVDVRSRFFGGRVLQSRSGARSHKVALAEHIRNAEGMGAGEILITSIDREGTMTGYDLELVRQATQVSTVPVIASGGAGTLADMHDAVAEGGASAAAAGSLFVFMGPLRGVLIHYPDRAEIENLFAPERPAK